MLSGIGIWSQDLRYGDPARVPEAAAEVEALGYSAIWVPDFGGELFADLDRLLDATSEITIATGVLNIWKHTPEGVGQWWSGLSQDRRDRVILGLGVSHAPLIGEQWDKPLTRMNAYLDGLEAAGVPSERLVLAALGPKMLDLAGRRTAGAHPYLVTAEHTKVARAHLGSTLLAVEVGVVLDDDLERGRRTASAVLDTYANLPNYTTNWKRFGYTDADIESRSDSLMDALFAVGDVAAIKERIDEHRAAGADHVCVQVISPEGVTFPVEAWRALAPRTA